jgi:translation initiation factor IF-1
VILTPFGVRTIFLPLLKEDTINMEGRVDEVLPSAMFRVKIDNLDTVVLAHLSGRMRKNNIKVLLGDRVEMEFTPYDLTRGRITRRK